jgi:hypothetical protein
MDPNMGNQGGKFPSNYQYMQGGNPGQMPPMNQMYMNQNPYMGNYYQMGMQQPMPNAFPNNYSQQNNNYQNNNNFGNKGRKQSDKQNYQKLDIKRI